MPKCLDKALKRAQWPLVGPAHKTKVGEVTVLVLSPLYKLPVKP